MTNSLLASLKKNLEALTGPTSPPKAKATPPKKAGSPPALANVIYGADKSVGFANFDFGKMYAAVGSDLEEGGKKGVEMVRLGKDWEKLIAKHKARKDLSKPYLQVGVLSGSLVLALRDDDNPAIDAKAVLIKDYTAFKKKLASTTTSVTNLDPGDATIDGSVRAVANKHKITADEGNYGEITGNIILDAHGTPDTLPNGRLIGTHLGQKTPQQIFELLTKDKDPKKRVAKSYAGTLTLCGCFTASGGPEASKQDDPFAMKVLDIFRAKGYKKISVVGYPGPMGVARGDSTDSHGTAMREGDELTWLNERTGADSALSARLTAELRDATAAYDRLVVVVRDAEAEKDRTLRAARDAMRAAGEKQKDFIAKEPGKTLYAAAVAADREFKRQDAAMKQAKVDLDRVAKEVKDSGLEDVVAGYAGRFGRRARN